MTQSHIIKVEKDKPVLLSIIESAVWVTSYSRFYDIDRTEFYRYGEVTMAKGVWSGFKVAI